MIKPGTICMIRGVPKASAGYKCNGAIVRIVAFVGDVITPEGNTHKNVHRFEPEIRQGQFKFCRSQEIWLHPLDPCEDDMARETLDRLDEQMRETFINTVLEKI